MKMKVTFSENTTNVGTEFAEDTKQIRTNFGKVHEVGGATPDAVLYTPQTLTEEQQAQARENIGAAEVVLVSIVNYDSETATYYCDKTSKDIFEYLKEGKAVYLIDDVGTDEARVYGLMESTENWALFGKISIEDYYIRTWTVYMNGDAYTYGTDLVMYEDDGNLYLGSKEPTEEWHAASKAYVDNAVKGKAYELIETITLEETAKLNLTEEPDGTPYAFDALLIIGTTEVGTASGDILFSFQGDNGASRKYQKPFLSAVTSGKRFFAVELYRSRGRWIPLWIDGTNPGVGQLYSDNFNRILETFDPDYNLKYITGVYTYALGAGSVVKIYAIRHEGV